MAKKNEEEAKVQEQEAQVAEGTQEETTQQPAESGKKEEEPAPAAPAPKVNAPKAAVAEGGKKVKIHTTEPVDCIIACIPYVIAKDKDAQVPADVAAILVNAKKAYRI